MTILMVLAAWVGISVPASLVVGRLLASDPDPELVGMDGPDALFVDPDGADTRVPLLTRAAR